MPQDEGSADGHRIRNMEEFAALSGISRPTVSKYFNDPASVRPSTRRRIEAALERCDYRPNLYAVNQNRRLTKTVGIVVPYLADPFFAEIGRLIERRCLEAGFWPVLFSSHGSPAIERDVLDSLRSLRPAGVLLAPLGRRSDRSAVEAFCRAVPTILFDSEIGGAGEAFIGSDNAQSIGLIVEHLALTGEPPCFFEMPPVNPNANKRRDAYRAAMERLGLEPHVIRTEGEDWDFEAIGYRGGSRILAARALPTNTVLCSNDRLAIGFLAAAFEAGLRVGRGPGFALRIAGHDDHPFSRFTCPPLTTVAQNYAAIAEQSVETLFQVIEAGGRLPRRTATLFDSRLVPRLSA
ncbi:LacI family DNA-binding transcriptional regulator [Rubellimicrobium sp. CFH 75288]|uniref:LacI family DNA-binding transcriptional regulator n=1 Tax=Rubellimicrobium sp. CFH 75288 TaxID=2697034 RepID=UPI00141222C6|nr:LacI family DNA-binding transcriptional regulator [Rubellimicrobium sp. CFH 75288]NAZ36679.1 substrate-binding domain-containing protein [Rubellimicrobium sp. CFH 75288]